VSFLLDLTKKKKGKQNRTDGCPNPTDPHTADYVLKENQEPDDTHTHTHTKNVGNTQIEGRENRTRGQKW
jgi:hypothetical protein